MKKLFTILVLCLTLGLMSSCIVTDDYDVVTPVGVGVVVGTTYPYAPYRYYYGSGYYHHYYYRPAPPRKRM